MAELSKEKLAAVAAYLDCKVADIVGSNDDGEKYVVLVDRGIAGTPKYYISYENIKPKTPKPKAAPETRKK